MSLHFNMNAMFFIKPFSTNGDPLLFTLSAIAVFLYAAIVTYYSTFKAHGKTFTLIGPVFEFANMFIYMTYNFWIILVLIFGQIIRKSFWLRSVCDQAQAGGRPGELRQSEITLRQSFLLELNDWSSQINATKESNST